MSNERLLWVVPEKKGGIQTYSEILWPAVKEAWLSAGGKAAELIQTELGRSAQVAASVLDIQKLQPDMVHIQHEYGLFGSKLPMRYTFPKWVRALREALPKTKIVATAHSVLGKDYRYPVSGRGWQAPLRWSTNRLALPLLQRLWNEKTWRPLDGVIVHSALQCKTLYQVTDAAVHEIPHFVPKANTSRAIPEPDLVLVFGFITPEKGQDIVIAAMAKLPKHVHLVLAGGLRRQEDQPYLHRCEKLIRDLDLSHRVAITGFVPAERIDEYYARASLVVAPFRETSGSGSLVQAFARGAAVLASDLPLNREIAERTSGALAFFKTEDPEDCARQIQTLIDAPESVAHLRQAACQYAEANSVAVIAGKHLEVYRAILR